MRISNFLLWEMAYSELIFTDTLWPDFRREHLFEAVREFLAGVPNLQLMGRNGMHRYNNQDHSMFTAMLSVENIFGAHHDVWSVNVEEEYHEEVAHNDEEPAPRG